MLRRGSAAEFHFNSTYKPGDYNEIEQYLPREVIYDQLLSPWKVQIVTDKEGKVNHLFWIISSDSFLEICQKDYKQGSPEW